MKLHSGTLMHLVIDRQSTPQLQCPHSEILKESSSNFTVI